MPKFTSADTLKDAVDANHKSNGHIISLFGCDHWFDVCLGILRRETFEKYVENWKASPDGHHCRCIWEKHPPIVVIDDDCPICVS